MTNVIPKNMLSLFDLLHEVLFKALLKPYSMVMVQIRVSKGQRNPGVEKVLFIMIVFAFLIYCFSKQRAVVLPVFQQSVSMLLLSGFVLMVQGKLSLCGFITCCLFNEGEQASSFISVPDWMSKTILVPSSFITPYSVLPSVWLQVPL